MPLVNPDGLSYYRFIPVYSQLKRLTPKRFFGVFLDFHAVSVVKRSRSFRENQNVVTKASSRAVVCLSASISISKACKILRNLHAPFFEGLCNKAL